MERQGKISDPAATRIRRARIVGRWLPATALAAVWLTRPAAADDWQRQIDILGAGLSDLPGAAAQIAQAEDAPAAPRSFDIPAQPLATALTEFGQQSGLQVTIDTDLAAAAQSRPVSGAYTPEEALRMLLAGTGVTYRFLDSGTVALERGPAQGAALSKAAPLTLEPVMVTATRSAKPVSAIPGSVIIIDRAQIEEQLKISSNPAEVLQKFIPGYSVANPTISGASESFRGRSLQVLVDGVQRNTPLRDVSRVLSMIDLNAVERIEVVNGPSGIYGNGATGGIVNFITKDATDGAPLVTIAAGLRAYTTNVGDSIAPELSTSITGDAGLFDYAATVTGQWTQDAYDGAGNLVPSDPEIGQGGRDNADDYTLNATVGRDFDGQRIEAQANVVSYTQTPDYFTDYSTDPVTVDTDAPYDGRSIQERSNYVTLRYGNEEFAAGDLEIAVFRNDVEKRFALAPLSPANSIVYYSGNPADPQDKNGQGTLLVEQIGLTATVTTPFDGVVQGMTVTWGVDYTYDETSQDLLDGRDIIAPMSQHGYAAFAQAEAPVAEWLTLSGGLRYERFDLELDDFLRPAVAGLFGNTILTLPEAYVTGGEFTYDKTVFNIGAVAHLTDAVDLFAGYSQGYSLPDVGGFTRRSGLPGVPTDWSEFAPKAATVENYEIGWRGNWARFRGQLSAFFNTSDYGTNFDPVTNTLSQQKEKIYGAELTAEVDATDSLILGAVLGYREGKQDRDQDGDYDAYLPNNRITTPFHGTLYADYQTDFDLGLRFEAIYFSGRDRDDGTTRFELEDAATFNLMADYPLLGGDLSFAVENLLDETYESPTATSTRNLPINAYGRTISLRYVRTF